jgi:tripartite-type tricarboxylate transporter receptor subunit TctC
VAGGAVDTIARILGQKLSGDLGQPILVENRVGAGGMIGADYVAKAPADGYVLLINFGPSHHTSQFFNRNMPSDPVRDFTPVALLGTAPQVIVVLPDLPVRSVGELLAYGRRNPGRLAYATSGVGTSQHIGGILLGLAGGVELTHIAYKGGAAALNDVLGGQVPVGIVVLSNVLPYIQSGRLRALGVLEAQRARMAPDIPTAAQSGVPGFSVPDTWAGVFGPAGLPAAIVAALNAAIGRALDSADVQGRLAAAGFEVRTSTPQDFAANIAASVQVYQEMLSRAGVRPE